MSVKGHLALLVGVFVVALAAVTLAQRSVVGELGAVVRDVAGSNASKARAARELWVSHPVERRALGRVPAHRELGRRGRPRAGATRPPAVAAELAAAGLDATEQATLAEADRLLADQQAATDRAVALRRPGNAAAAARVAEQATGPAGQRSPLVAGVLAGTRPLLLLDVGALTGWLAR